MPFLGKGGGFGDSPLGMLGNDKIQTLLSLLSMGNQWLQQGRATKQNAMLMDSIMRGFDERKAWEAGRFDTLNQALNTAGADYKTGLGRAQQTLNTAFPSADPRNIAADTAMLLWGQKYPYGFNKTMNTMGAPRR